ncbi:hypothetical protein ACFGVS_22310 [Mucilaginibacter sp. AW1-7]|jgi:hypothetical protein|uniref:hypothetical protein n=1 Tax=unclassified Mucilaginibacter TaxID=2617802 RepID=UPI0023661896|nr:hypothetical protein [Mucilaginibacter sp. KACC 22773]WDF78236.1 hypothetical protein PQ469_30585 [Mucilaginibacter sp. KACC 22773]
MKILLTMISLSALLSGCQNESGNPPVDIETTGGLNGVEIVETSDKYDVTEGLYYVHATIKTTGKQVFRNVYVCATYYNAMGHVVAKSKGEADLVLNPGDKDVVETACFFPTSSDMPTRVVLTTEEEYPK